MPALPAEGQVKKASQSEPGKKKLIVGITVLLVVGLGLISGYHLLFATDPTRVTGQAYDAIRLGMASSGVKAILGRPSMDSSAFFGGKFDMVFKYSQCTAVPEGSDAKRLFQNGTLELVFEGDIETSIEKQGYDTHAVAFPGQILYWDGLGGRGITIQFLDGKAAYKTYRGTTKDFHAALYIVGAEFLIPKRTPVFCSEQEFLTYQDENNKGLDYISRHPYQLREDMRATVLSIVQAGSTAIDLVNFEFTYEKPFKYKFGSYTELTLQKSVRGFRLERLRQNTLYVQPRQIPYKFP